MNKQEDFDAYYFNIVEEVNEFNDWCISEDSVWGLPIPFFTRRDSGEVLIDPEIVSHVADIFRLHGSDAWFTFPVKDLLPARYQNIADKLDKGDQVFDVWFDNALTWNYVLNENDYHESNPLTVQMNQRLKEIAKSSPQSGLLLQYANNEK